MQDLLAAIHGAIQDEYDVTLAESILRTAEPERIRDAVDAFCARELGARAAGCHVCVLSVGAAFGLTLADGRDVFLKVHHPDVALDSLRAMTEVQDALARGGFPCPAVLHPPSPFGAGAATVEALVAGGGTRDAREPAVRDAMAEALAELVARTRRIPVPPALPRGELASASGALWPKPHNALFDLTVGGAGAERIDAVARRAKAALREGPRREVVGHMDWKAEHFRFDEAGRIRVIYDWDSLRLDDECAFVGYAAATFPVRWDVESPPKPSPEEALAFVRAYERARGAAFSTAELRRVSAAATYLIAYVARCEHSADPRGAKVEDSFRAMVARAADADYIPLG